MSDKHMEKSWGVIILIILALIVLAVLWLG
jgi:uncharacterized integral membrane protein